MKDIYESNFIKSYHIFVTFCNEFSEVYTEYIKDRSVFVIVPSLSILWSLKSY